MNYMNIWNHLKYANVNIGELLQIIPNFLIPYNFHLCERIKTPSPQTTHSAEHPHCILTEPCTTTLPSALGPSGSTSYYSPSIILNKPLPCWYQTVLFSLFSGSLDFDALKVIFTTFQSPPPWAITNSRSAAPQKHWAMLSIITPTKSSRSRKATKGTVYLHAGKCFPSRKRCQYREKHTDFIKGEGKDADLKNQTDILRIPY